MQVTRKGATQPRPEHHAAFEYERGGDGTFHGRGQGTTNCEVFEAYLEQVLTPVLRRGQIVVMDNLTARKGERVKEVIEGRGCKLVYLSPYSPHFNPIEEAFSKIKGLLRKSEARTREALVEAIGTAISAVTGEDACGFFKHYGYRAVVQSLC
jgi:transposase